MVKNAFNDSLMSKFLVWKIVLTTTTSHFFLLRSKTMDTSKADDAHDILGNPS